MRDIVSHSLPLAVKSSLSQRDAYSVGLRYSGEMDRACRAMPIRWLDAALDALSLASNGGARAELPAAPDRGAGQALLEA